MQKIVIVVSACAEWRAVKELLRPSPIQTSPLGEWFHARLGAFDVLLFHGGWGKISAAASAQYILDHFHPDLLVNLGTCGGFLGRIETGTVILVERTLVYDIVEQMSDSDQAIGHYTTRLDLSWLADDEPQLPAPGSPPIIRGLLVSADRDIIVQDIPMLVEKYGAVAADWESGAIAWVAHRNGVRCLILRAVSDLVGSTGGEAYGDYEFFAARTRQVMETLVGQLPAWLSRVRWVT